MQVYAIVCCPDTQEVLVFKKKYRGQFFKKKFNTKFKKSLNGANLNCFPGGKLEHEEVVKGAIREFGEEVGVDLCKHSVFCKFEDFVESYTGVVFSYTEGEFGVIFNKAKENIDEKEHILNSTDFKGGRIEEKNALLEKLAIKDDELESVERVKIENPKILFGSDTSDKKVGWFLVLSYDLAASLGIKIKEEKCAVAKHEPEFYQQKKKRTLSAYYLNDDFDDEVETTRHKKLYYGEKKEEDEKKRLRMEGFF